MGDELKREYMPGLAWAGCVVAMAGAFFFCLASYRYLTADAGVVHHHEEAAIFSGIAMLGGAVWAVAFGAGRYLFKR